LAYRPKGQLPCTLWIDWLAFLDSAWLVLAFLSLLEQKDEENIYIGLVYLLAK
jgi:hypothetical protein